MVAHIFNPSTWEAEAGRSLSSREFKASLTYKVSSRTARTAKETLSRKTKNKQNVYKNVHMNNFSTSVAFLILFFTYFVCWGGCLQATAHVESRGQPVEAASLLPPCGWPAAASLVPATVRNARIIVSYHLICNTLSLFLQERNY